MNSGSLAIPGKLYTTIMIEMYAQFIPFLRLATRLCYLAPSLALQSYFYYRFSPELIFKGEILELLEFQTATHECCAVIYSFR